MNKKLLSGILAVTLMCTVLSGCGGNKTEGTQSDLQSGSILDYKVCDEPLELTFFAGKDPNYQAENNVFKQAFEHTNVMLKHDLSNNAGDMMQQLAIAASSKDLSDIIYAYSRDTFVDYGTQGALIPLNDLIEKHAPNFKKYLDEHEDVKKYITADDGNIYYVPNVRDPQVSPAWFIRQDWLDKLGLEQPDTIDEFYDVLCAFRDKDPNGNGKADEVPLFGIGSAVQYEVAQYLGIFDAAFVFRYMDGKVVYGPTEENFKTAIKTLAKWYAEGLIDPEIFTRKKTREYFLGNDLGGSTHNWIGSTAGYNDTYKDDVPGINFVVMAPPASSAGVRRETNGNSKGLNEGWSISANNAHPEETMKYFDFWWTEEGRRTANYGVEGFTYTMEDGKPVYTDYVLNNEELVPISAIRSTGAQSNFGYWQNFEFELQYLNDIAAAGVDLYIDNGYFAPETPMFTYTAEEQKRMSTLGADIITCVEETVQKWILGNEDVDLTYDSYIKDLNKLGLEEYVSIEQAAYDRYLAE